MIVGLLAEKGGTGKTTITTNISGMRAAAGRRTLLVDADRQGSSRFWAQTRSSLRLRVKGGDMLDHRGVAAEGFCPLKRSAKSNCLTCQGVEMVGFQFSPVLIMLLSMVSNFRIHAVRATFLGFPASSNRW